MSANGLRNAVLFLLICGGALLSAARAWADTTEENRFVLREPLGQAWENDLVTFDLPKGAAAGGEAFTLLGPDEKPQPFQVHADSDDVAVSFLAALPASGEASYRLVKKPSAAAANPFKIEQGAATIQITNGITGIEVPTAKGDFTAGPIGRVRLRSGRWVGKSLLADVPPIESYDAKVTAEGPVFAELECRYRFAGGATWMLTARLVAGEPVILFRETFQVAPAAVWEFVMGGTWTPKWVTMMPGTGPAPYATKPVAFNDSPAAVIGPWIQWWDAKQGLVCALSSGPEGEVHDVLAIAAGNVAAWARSEPGAYDNAPQRFLQVKGRKDETVAIRLPLMGPGRSWMLAAGSDDDLDGGDEKPSTKKVASFHKLMNRYMETPLDAVKDMPLQWERKAAPWPVLGIGRARQGAKAPPQGSEALKSKVMKELDDTVKIFRYGNGGYPAAMYGTLIPRVALVELLPSLDLALGTGIFTDEELDHVCSQLAFVALKLASPDYVSPGRGLAGNPNMVTAWSTSLVLLAAMIPDHPDAKAWYRQGMGRLDNMLETWQGPNGGWLEAPHYQMVAVDPILYATMAAANAGLVADAKNERLLRTSLFLAKISTPPNPDFGGLRHFPPLGNTYRQETSAVFGAMAAIHADSSPAAAAELQWVWQQQGRPQWGGLGGAFFLNSYAGALVRSDWSPPPPAWKSELFPGFGAVLRSGFPGPRETYLVYHQGEVATAHYDNDQGSFEMWGKGRPLCLDWGYQGYMAASLHNRVSVGTAGKVTDFATEPAADLILGRQGPWTRQVLFVKDADPLGPNYFVIRDRIDGQAAAEWRLWVNARQEGAAAEPMPAGGILQRPLAKPQLTPAVVIDGSVIRFTGRHDVDLDVWLASPSRNPVADAEFEHAAVRSLSGDVGGGSRGDDRLDQIGIKLAPPGSAPLVGVLYPRLRDAEKPPVFHSIADGRGVRVEGAWGTDHVFLAEESFEFEADDIRFQGTAGVIQQRGQKTLLTLCAAGKIAAGGQEITRNAAEKTP